MGIPRFFRFITETFPDTFQRVGNGLAIPQPDNLYLDANSIIHNCAREIYFKPHKPRLAKQIIIKNSEPADKEKELFEAICAYMDKLLKMVKPRQLFYIAIDGPAPIAKQTQQRQRRYKTALTKTLEELQIFDTTSITPGTRFMFELSKYITWYIQKMISIDKYWQNVKIIYSGPQTPGEGEHKIVEWIRKDPASRNKTHCMYGLDADLFMLSLATACPKFYLLREDQWNDSYFFIVDIGKLRRSLHQKWGKGLDEDSLIKEFVFTCFLIGNDFLHPSPSFHDLGESIPFVMDLRQELLGNEQLICNGKINLINLTSLFEKLALTECAAISAQFYKQHLPNLTINNSLIDQQHPELGINIEKFRELYYKKINVTDAEIHTMCNEYLQGLDWVNYYYYNKCNNWHWYYPYHYTPLLSDLVIFLKCGANISSPSAKKSPPLLPFQQLLCIVPPSSKGLLPQFLQDLFLQFPEYFPTNFNIDYEGKQQEWEGIALLPFINVEKILHAYKEAESKAKSRGVRTEFARNQFANTCQYWYTSSGIKNSIILKID